MLRIATANYGFRQWSIDDYLYAVAGLGLKYAEVGYTRRGTLQELYHVTDHSRALASAQLLGTLTTDSGIERTKKLARDAGVKMVSSTVNYRLWGVSPTWLEWAKANIRLDIEIGSQLGLEVMRVAEVAIPPGTREEEVFDQVEQTGKILNELAEHAEQHGVVIMAENYNASSDLILAVASHFTSPAVGIHYDAHNYRRAGEDPVEAFRKVKRYVRYCHLKDYRREDAQGLPSDSWWPSWAIGEGEIDWKPLLAELGDSYDGVTAIEYEKTLFDVLPGMRVSIDYIRRLLDELNTPYD